jgi:hypothetical protein
VCPRLGLVLDCGHREKERCVYEREKEKAPTEGGTVDLDYNNLPWTA